MKHGNSGKKESGRRSGDSSVPSDPQNDEFFDLDELADDGPENGPESNPESRSDGQERENIQDEDDIIDVTGEIEGTGDGDISDVEEEVTGGSPDGGAADDKNSQQDRQNEPQQAAGGNVPAAADSGEGSGAVSFVSPQTGTGAADDGGLQMIVKRHRRSRIIRLIVFLVVLALIGGGVFWYYEKSRTQQTAASTTGSRPEAAGQASDLDVITASGTTSIGIVNDTFDLTLSSDTSLEIEKVYVSSQDTVSKGDPILKLTDDSIKAAKTSLDQTARAAEYAYDLGAVDAKVNTVSAGETYNKAVIAAKYAQQDYDDTIAKAQAEIDDLQSQVDDQQDIVDEYTAAAADPDYYNKKYKVSEIKAQLTKDFELEQSLYGDSSNDIADHLNNEENTSANTSSSTGTSGGTSGGSGFGGGAGGGMPGGSSAGSSTAATDSSSTEASSESSSTEASSESSSTASSTESSTAATSESGDLIISENSSSAVVSPDVTLDSAAGASGAAGTGTGGTASSDTSSKDISSIVTVTTTSSSGSSGTGSGTASGTASGTGSSTDSDAVSNPLVSAYKLLRAEVIEEEDEYDTAVATAKDLQAKAESGLEQAQNKLESLQLQLKSAQTALVTTTESAKETLDTANAEATAAKETYDTSLRSIQNDLDTLQDAKDTAEENLTAFNDTIGDGYFYASNDGTIMMIGVKTGETLTKGTTIAVYTDPGTISINASVAQASISQLSVGDACYAVFSDEGTFSGTITSINPTTQSNSKTSVTYTVVVTLSGDVSTLKENTSATVYFGSDAASAVQMAGGQAGAAAAASTSQQAQEAQSGDSQAQEAPAGDEQQAQQAQTGSEQ
jgi:multidrug resistance efflux pump